MIWKVIKIILVAICMISIFMFSADPAEASDAKSNHVIVTVAEFFAGHDLSAREQQEKIDQYVVLVRKGAHLSIYFLLGFLVISLLKEYVSLQPKHIFYAFLFCFLYACSDEVHQLFVPGRSGSIIDVGIDSMGSIFGILFYSVLYKFRRRV